MPTGQQEHREGQPAGPQRVMQCLLLAQSLPGSGRRALIFHKEQGNGGSSSSVPFSIANC